MKQEKEKLTVRVTVKMDEALHEKLQRRAKRKGVTVSAYIRSLIDRKQKRASDECYECLGRLEQATDKDDCPRHVYEFIREKYAETAKTENGGDVV